MAAVSNLHNIMSANAQHNLAALQTQLQTLQLENAAVTKGLCLKENYLLQKEQQLRVLQQRMEELEASVATWKDRYLQQLHQNAATSTAVANTSSAKPASGVWTALPLPAPSSAQAVPNADAMGSLVEKLSTNDREKLKTLIGMERLRHQPETARGPWEERFGDVSEELRRVLMQYLLPVLLETQRLENQRFPANEPMVIQCVTRTYEKTTMDYKILCQRQSDANANNTNANANKTNTNDNKTNANTDGTALANTSGVAATGIDPATPTATFSSSSATTTTTLTPPSSTAAGGTMASAMAASSASDTPSVPFEEEHLFDCVDCESGKRHATPVPHGAREIHATKAIYISRPLAAASTSSSSSSSVMRRYTMATGKSPSSSGADAGSSSSSRAASGMSLTGPLSSTAAASSSSYRSDLDMDGGDRRSGASSHSSSLTGTAPTSTSTSSSSSSGGKSIKKIMGSVMKGLNRHKPQLALPSPSPTTVHHSSSSHSSHTSSQSTSATSLAEDEDDSICDGCGRGPLTTLKWICRTCKISKNQEFELCEKCYGQGAHGKENAQALFDRIEEIVISKCPKLAREQELMKLLQMGICKGNLKKYSFCLTWIADLLLCKGTSELRARALEISQISPQVRSEFVRLLAELLTKYRKDIELITEWQPVQNVASVGGGGAIGGGGGGGDEEGDHEGGGTMLQLDTLRIWVKDVVVDAASK